MKRRHFLGGALATGALSPRVKADDLCGCSLLPQFAAPAANQATSATMSCQDWSETR